METRLRDLETEGRKLADENRRLQDTLERNSADARRTIDRQAAVIDELDFKAHLRPPPVFSMLQDPA